MNQRKNGNPSIVGIPWLKYGSRKYGYHGQEKQYHQNKVKAHLATPKKWNRKATKRQFM